MVSVTGIVTVTGGFPTPTVTLALIIDGSLTDTVSLPDIQLNAPTQHAWNVTSGASAKVHLHLENPLGVYDVDSNTISLIQPPPALGKIIIPLIAVKYNTNIYVDVFDENPIRGATAQIRRVTPDQTDWLAYMTTDDSGLVVFDNLPAGQYYILINHPCFMRENYQGQLFQDYVQAGALLAAGQTYTAAPIKWYDLPSNLCYNA